VGSRWTTVQKGRPKTKEKEGKEEDGKEEEGAEHEEKR